MGGAEDALGTHQFRSKGAHQLGHHRIQADLRMVREAWQHLPNPRVVHDVVPGARTSRTDTEAVMRMAMVDFGPLRKAFPDLFARDESGWVESAAVGAGWAELVLDLFTKLDALSRQRVAEGHPPLRLSVIKEKYGALSVDLRGGFVREAEDLIDEAEARSETICEACGALGRPCLELRWVKTLFRIVATEIG